MGATQDTAAFAANLTYDDIPERLHAKTKAQILSVVGASHAGRHSEGAVSALDVARTWGSGDDAVAWLTGERLPHLNAMFANACASVSFDFDDYLFAGHTGHSAVCAAFAYGEKDGASGKDVLTAITVGNEVGGRLGASLLFGPQNGQMWSYIHLLEGACIASRFHSLDVARTANAIGIAFTQPPYALIPAFMGPDSKMLIPASTTVEGCKAAELAARGWTGNTQIIEDNQGFLKRFNQQNLGWILSGYGEAWLSDTLTYKIVPGCAYIDTAMDSFGEIRNQFAADHDARFPTADDIDRIEVKCGLLTSGMEAFSQAYRSADRLEPITINFSVALSIGLTLVAGSLAPEFLSHKYLDASREAIEAVASKVTMTHDNEMDSRAAATSASKGFELAKVLGAKSLEGLSFEGYVMSFPSNVTVYTTDGKSYNASQDVPLGGAGSDWQETDDLVRLKFLDNFAGDASRAKDVLDAIDSLEQIDDVRDLARLLAADR
ncbi:MAG: MmgE/PrpD family protein [Actinomycetota bacterium]